MTAKEFFYNPRHILLLTLAILIVIALIKIATTGSVLGQKTEVSPAPTGSVAPSPRSSPAKTTKKSSYTIAVYGDSMVDTMGDNLEHLQKALATEYPETKFTLYNYGIGSQNVEDGLKRFQQKFDNKERHYQSIVALKPDIIIMGTFAYNPFPQHSKDRHFRGLGELLTKATSVTKNLYVLAEIAPLESEFGVGQHGVNWPPDVAAAHALKIIDQLQNGRQLAKARNLTLVDGYLESQALESKFGIKTYVNGDDGIHPSVQGHVLMANMIARSLKLE